MARSRGFKVGRRPTAASRKDHGDGGVRQPPRDHGPARAHLPPASATSTAAPAPGLLPPASASSTAAPESALLPPASAPSPTAPAPGVPPPDWVPWYTAPASWYMTHPPRLSSQATAPAATSAVPGLLPLVSAPSTAAPAPVLLPPVSALSAAAPAPVLLTPTSAPSTTAPAPGVPPPDWVPWYMAPASWYMTHECALLPPATPPSPALLPPASASSHTTPAPALLLPPTAPSTATPEPCNYNGRLLGSRVHARDLPLAAAPITSVTVPTDTHPAPELLPLASVPSHTTPAVGLLLPPMAPSTAPPIPCKYYSSMLLGPRVNVRDLSSSTAPATSVTTEAFLPPPTANPLLVCKESMEGCKYVNLEMNDDEETEEDYESRKKAEWCCGA